MASILIADDDEALLLALELALLDRGHVVTKAPDGKIALARIGEDGSLATKIDLVISDVSMPHVDGFSLTRQLRAKGRTLPIIILTSRDNELDEALGLDLGADDYVAKPFSMRVLLARVDALLRRSTVDASPPGSANLLRRGKLTLDRDRLQISYADTRLEATVSEFRLLETLVTRPGIVISRARLLEQVRGDDSFVGDRIIDTYVSRIRRKLQSVEPECDLLETVVGAGYRWRE